MKLTKDEKRAKLEAEQRQEKMVSYKKRLEKMRAQIPVAGSKDVYYLSDHVGGLFFGRHAEITLLYEVLSDVEKGWIDYRDAVDRLRRQLSDYEQEMIWRSFHWASQVGQDIDLIRARLTKAIETAALVCRTLSVYSPLIASKKEHDLRERQLSYRVGPCSHEENQMGWQIVDAKTSARPAEFDDLGVAVVFSSEEAAWLAHMAICSALASERSTAQFKQLIRDDGSILVDG